MAFNRVTSINLRPDRVMAFRALVAELSAAASDSEDGWHWTAHQTIFGEGFTMHFASRIESFADVEKQGQIELLWARVLGEKRGAEAMTKANECMQSLSQTISIDRPDLSYVQQDPNPVTHPYAVVTTALARPGHADACEELIRKVAEAIPKVGDPSRLHAYQVMFGRIGSYWTMRPLGGLAELDKQLPPTELLNQAFGASEGGLLWRNGSEAIEEAHREVVLYVPELSSPPHA